MTRWLVVGARGMLGTDLVTTLDGRDVTGLDLPEIDITDDASVAAALLDHHPDVVVNTAAWTAVDAAEEHEDQAFQVNAVGPAVLARACAAVDARMVQLSTDYVFDGNATEPYPEDATPRPTSAYGRTKAAGEWAVRAQLPGRSWIVRTAWLYGAAGPNFVSTMLRLETERDAVDVVTDQRGQPTWTRDLAALLVRMVDGDAQSGTYHATSSGATTWYELACEVFAAVGADPGRVHPTTSDRFPRPARRPASSVLGHARWAHAGLRPIRPWRDALNEAVPVLRAVR